jgi:hypothetical protein
LQGKGWKVAIRNWAELTPEEKIEEAHADMLRTMRFVNNLSVDVRLLHERLNQIEATVKEVAREVEALKAAS